MWPGKLIEEINRKGELNREVGLDRVGDLKKTRLDRERERAQ